MLMRFLLIFVLIMLVGRAVLRLLIGIIEGATPAGSSGARPEKGELMVRDPVCGTYVVPSRALAVRDKQGVHYFCSDKCRQAFVSR
jgi:YHS domain-containing protein